MGGRGLAWVTADGWFYSPWVGGFARHGSYVFRFGFFFCVFSMMNQCLDLSILALGFLLECFSMVLQKMGVSVVLLWITVVVAGCR